MNQLEAEQFLIGSDESLKRLVDSICTEEWDRVEGASMPRIKPGSVRVCPTSRLV